MAAPRFIRAEVIEPALFTAEIGHFAVAVDLTHGFARDELETAARRLVAVFPVLGARYEPGLWRDRWVIAPEGAAGAVRVTAADGDLEAATRRALAEPPHALRGWPFRVVQLEHAGGARLLLLTLHLVGDGGALATAAAVYAALLAGRDPALTPGSRNLTAHIGGYALRHARLAVDDMARELVRAAAIPVLPRWDRPFGAPARGGAPAYHRIRLAPDETAAIVAAARAAGATQNDALVAAALRVQSLRTAGPLVSAAYTVDLRRYADSSAPVVANLMGFNTLNLRRAALAEPRAALCAVRNVTGDQKRRAPGLASNLSLLIAFGMHSHGALHLVGRAIKGGLTGFARRVPLVTNVGAVDGYLGDLFAGRLQDAWAAGLYIPRLPTPVVSATSCRGALSVVVSHAGNLDDTAVAAFTADWREALAWLAAAA